jgi:hypothetical protein
VNRDYPQSPQATGKRWKNQKELRRDRQNLADAAVPAPVEEVRPRHHVGVLPEQRPALALGHAAPNAELDLVVQRVRPAFLHYRAVTADDRGLALGGAADKQFVGIGGPTECSRYPGNPFFGVNAAQYPLCSRDVCPTPGRSRS